MGGVRPENEPMCRCRIWRRRLAGTRTVNGEFYGDSSAVVVGVGDVELGPEERPTKPGRF
jgi:hypothetical protein